jgi:hypothetical protein
MDVGTKAETCEKRIQEFLCLNEMSRNNLSKYETILETKIGEERRGE